MCFNGRSKSVRNKRAKHVTGKQNKTRNWETYFCSCLLSAVRHSSRQILNSYTNKFREWQVPSRTKAGRHEGFTGKKQSSREAETVPLRR